MSNVTWEYSVLPITSELAAGGAEALEPLLDELGSEGWELVAVDPSAEPTIYVFKRRLAAASQEGDEAGYEADDAEDADDDDEYDEDGTIRINLPGGRR